MPGKTPRKAAPPSPAPSEEKMACAEQLRKIGDKWNLRQKLLNFIAKFFCPDT
uniref:Phorbol-12-myristate-13-acetate-induced protein 1 n=1 Tax=Salvator merianae TaxID=96440 RepID=A0A8D0DSG9_SALMN